MRALILVDIQNDFVSGSLAVENAVEVVPVANQLLRQFELVVATQDWHPADHGSFASQNPGVEAGEQFELGGLPQTAWPDHCIENTTGAQFVEQLDARHSRMYFAKGPTERLTATAAFLTTTNGRPQAWETFSNQNR